jgi:very-short-patch-repair endonuclease/DNA polymerase III delta prime subunit
MSTTIFLLRSPATRKPSSLRHAAGAADRGQPDRTPPRDEFLVLDADPSQNYAINTALAGRNLVIQGPPGTGKSQTITNLISALVARGKKVLFVAEKRAAIDAVLGRLARVGLGSLTLDLHSAAANRAVAYEQFRDAIQSARQTPPVDQNDLHQRLSRLRSAMVRHDQIMHMPREPWGVTVFELQNAMLGTPDSARTPVRISRAGLNLIQTRDHRHEVRETLGRLVGIGGLLPVTDRGPWATAIIESPDQAIRARDCVRSLLGELPVAREVAESLASAVGVEMPASPAAANRLVDMCRRTVGVRSIWRPEIWQQDLSELIAATGDRNYRRAAGIRIGYWQRRGLRKRARRLRLGPGGALHQELVTLDLLRRQWQELGCEPPTVVDVDGSALQGAVERLTTLSTILGAEALVEMPWDAVKARLESLAADASGPMLAAQARVWSAELRTKGLGPLLDWLTRNVPEWPPDQRRQLAEESFEYAWSSTVLDEIGAHDHEFATFNASNHRTAVAQFAETDKEHIARTPERIRRLLAERLTQVRSTEKDQDLFLDRELTRKRKLKPLRDLIDKAPDILLAAKPCWAMSPLLVSQVLPPKRLFDVVIFDEASQVQPAEAVPSLARAYTAVIAGDSKQLPPTTFFERRVEDDEEEDDESLDSDVESILDAFNRALEDALRQRLREHPDLQPFFGDDRAEPFFVKNLERVQGDERDAIILSVGFGKVNGRLVRRFGPLNRAGGERRLNVAVTRARRSMTVVCSFTPDELDPESLTAEGAKALALFLRYVDSGGRNQTMLGPARRLNPFEISVRDRLVEAGLDLAPQWGVAGYYIDFAVRHPQRRDEMVLAIEADGATYHSTETARARDRLRQEHLERLGWKFHRIWSTEWFNNREAAVAAVLAAYKEAVAAADAATRAPKQRTALDVRPSTAEQPLWPDARCGGSRGYQTSGATVSLRRGPRPHIVPGTPISQYTQKTLVSILEWIRSDGLLRTDEELLRAASKELGYSRVGSNIRAALTDAIRRLPPR